MLILVPMLFTIHSINAQSVAGEIEAANKAGQVVFLVVTDAQTEKNADAMQVAYKAHNLYDNSKVIILNRADENNKQLVSKYQVSSAPLPLILVIASNGIVTGGYLLQQATPELLVKAIPSPKKGEVIKVLSEGKSVFLLVTGKNMSKSNELLGTCEKACVEMNNKAKIIEISMEDPLEKQFLTELRIDPDLNQPKTYVINAKGQLTGTFNSDVSSSELVATAKKISAGGCCGPGSNKSCGPSK